MKLPQIQYSGTPQIPSADPRSAAVASQQRLNILDQVQRSAAEVTGAYREFQVTKADAAYADEMAKVRQEAANLSALPAGAVNALDLDIDTSDNQDVLKAEWYPRLLAKRMQENREKYAATIKSPVDRQRWLSEVERNDNLILEKESAIALKETEAYKTQEMLATWQEALEKGDLTTMQMILNDSGFLRDADSLAQRNNLQKQFNAAQEEVELESVQTRINATINGGTDAEVQAELENLLDPEKRKNIPGGERTAQILTNRVKAEQDRRMRNSLALENASLQQRNRVVKSSLNKVEAAMQSGMPVFEFQLNELEEQAQGTDYQESVSLLRKTIDYSARDFQQREADKSAAQAKGLDGSLEYRAYVAQEEQIEKNLEQGGYAYAVTNVLGEQGYIPLTSPEAYDERVAQVEMLATTYYGTETQPGPVPVIGPSEVKGIEAMLSAATPAEQWDWAQKFSERPQVIGELVDGGMGSFGISAGSKDYQLFIDVQTGKQRMNSDYYSPPPKAEVMQAWRDYAGSTLIDVPNVETAYIDTVMAAYANAAPEGDEGIFDTKVFEEQARRVMPIVAINGQTTIAPYRIDEDTFQSFVDSYSPEQVAALGGELTYTDEMAAEKIRDGQWVPAGNGKYNIISGNQLLMSAQTGEPLEAVFNEQLGLMRQADDFAEKQRTIKQSEINIPSMPGF